MNFKQSFICILSCLLVFAGVVWVWEQQNERRLAAVFQAQENQAPEDSDEEETNTKAVGGQIEETFDNKAHATSNSPYRLSNSTKEFKAFIRSESAILLRNALIDVDSDQDLGIPEHLSQGDECGIWLVKSRGTITKSFHDFLIQNGANVDPSNYIPHNTLLVGADAETIEKIRSSSRVAAAVPFEPYYRVEADLMAEAVEDLALPFDALLKLTVFKGEEEKAAERIAQLGAEIVKMDRSPFGQQFIVLPKVGGWLDLVRMDEVQLVEKYRKRVYLNDLSRVRVGVSTNTIATETHLNLTGSNVVVAVNDSGIDTNHVAFGGRAFVADGDPTDTVGHGTHVAGIIGGDGSGVINAANVSGSDAAASFKGMAPGVSMVGFDLTLADYELQEWPALTNIVQFGKTNAVIINNSWGYGTHSYDSAAASWDAAVRDAIPGLSGEQPILAVFSAGNDGGGGRNGQGGYADSITSPATFKNGITVGALEQERNMMEEFYSPISSNSVCDTATNSYADLTDTDNEIGSFSSRGNVDPDIEGVYGRFKPDLIAPGVASVSTRSDSLNATNFYWFPPTDSITYFFEGITLRSGETNSDVFTIVNNTTNVTMQIENPSVTGVIPLFTNQLAQPSRTAAYFAGTNMTNFAVDDSMLGLWYVDMINTNTEEITFDFRVVVTYTNCATPEFNLGYSNLNESVTSHSVSNGYMYHIAGTSFSAPVVSGMAALMQELFEEIGVGNGARTLSPALMKALLINSSRTPNESYTYDFEEDFNRIGWGLPNIRRTLPEVLATSPETDWPVQFFDQSATNAVETGTSHKRTVDVSGLSVDAPLRVTLVWTDPPGNPAASLKLVNDLDLVVSNASGIFYHGNSFRGSQFSVQAGETESFENPDTGMTEMIDLGGTNDIVNNVESVYIEGPIDEPFDVYVIGNRVNVNAVTGNTNGILQDYALVISSGDILSTGELAVEQVPVVVTNPLPRVTYFDPAGETNNALLNQRVGANNPYLVATNGTTNQWSFYVVTNSAGGANAAFVTFFPPNLARSRGVSYSEVPTDRALSADIDIYVSQDPDLTNLVDAVVDAADKSAGRGGSEFVIYDNSVVGDVYYVGIKSEDQQSAEFGFFSIFTDEDFANIDSEGNVTVNGLGPVVIPDGIPARPGITNMFLLNPFPIDVRRVVVTNHTLFHELHGDLVGELRKDERWAILNNHRSISNTAAWTDIIYDDSEENDIVGAIVTDGPNSLNNFIGMEGAGLWMFNIADNAFLHTGRVDSLDLWIEPSNVTNANGGSFYDPIQVSLGPNASYQNFINVPAGAVSITFNVAFDAVAGNGAGPIELRVREGELVSDADYDFEAIGMTPGFSLNISVADSPPLNPGQYFFRLKNLTSDPTDLTLIIEVEYDFGVNPPTTFTSSAAVRLDDNALTNGNNGGIFISEGDRSVTDIKVGIRTDHARASDLSYYLISPSGTRVLLAENRGYLSTNGYGLGTNVEEYVHARFSEDEVYASKQVKFVDANAFVPYIEPKLLATNFLTDEEWSAGISLATGGEEESRILIPTGQTSGQIQITYNASYEPDRWKIVYEGATLYDSGWVSNLPQEYTFVPGDVNVGTDEITIAGHTLFVGQVVWLVNPQMGAAGVSTVSNLPGGLGTYRAYEVFAINGDDVQLAILGGAVAIDITGVGTGTHYFYAGFVPFAATSGYIPYTGTSDIVEIVVNEGAHPDSTSTAYQYSFDLLDAGGNPYTPADRRSSQRATSLTLADGKLFVAGQTDAFATNAIIANFSLPMIDNALPSYSIDWPAKQGGSSFYGVSASADNVYAFGDSYTFTEDLTSKTVKGVAARFDFDTPQVLTSVVVPDGTYTDNAPGGSELIVQLPEIPNAFTYSGKEHIYASKAVTESGVDMIYYAGSAEENGSNPGRMILGKFDTSTDSSIWVTNDVYLMMGDAYSSGNALTYYDTNIYVGGGAADVSSGAQTNAVVYKFDTNGNPVTSYTHASDSHFYGATKLGDSVVFAGVTGGFGTDADFLITAFDDSLSPIWSVNWDRGSEDYLYGIISHGDRLFAVGSTINGSGDRDAILFGIDAETGAVLTTTLYTGFDVSSAGDQIFRAVDIDGFDLYAVGEMLSSEMSSVQNDFMVLRYQIAEDMYPEEDLSSFIGENADGFWRIETLDARDGGTNGIASSSILSWELELGLSLENSAPLPLFHLNTVTNQVTGDQVRYYKSKVPFTATQATLDFESLSGFDFDVGYNVSGLPDLGVGTDFTIAAGVNTARQVILDAASTPPIAAGQCFYLAITNNPAVSGGNDIENEIEVTVTYDSTGTTLAYQGGLFSGSVDAVRNNSELFQFSIAENEAYVDFTVTNLVGQVDVILSKSTLPNTSDHDFRLQITGDDNGVIRIEPNSELLDIGGTWFARLSLMGVNGATYDIRLVGENAVPLISAVSDRTINEGTVLNVAVDATDANELTYSLVEAPQGASINSDNGDISWLAAESSGPGITKFKVQVTDDGVPNLSATTEFFVTVNEVNEQPVLPTLATQTVNEGEFLTFSVAASDSDLPANQLTYSLESDVPSGLSLTSAGIITWTPPEGTGNAQFQISVRVSDNGIPSLGDTQDYSIQVSGVNSAPRQESMEDLIIVEGSMVTLTNLATDPDQPANNVFYAVESEAVAKGLSINGTNGVITWQTGEADGPSTNFVELITYDDGLPVAYSTQSFAIVVLEENQPPISLPNVEVTVEEFELLDYQILATDPDIPVNTLSYAIDGNAPAGLTIDGSSGVVKWTPGELDGPSQVLVDVVVKDDGVPSLETRVQLKINVLERNEAPVLNDVSDVVVDEGNQMSFIVSATDSDLPKNQIQYSLFGEPAGMSVDAATGELLWTPAENQGPGQYRVTVHATDNGVPSKRDSKQFIVSVGEVNLPPSLVAIDDREIPEGETFTYTLSVTDPDLPVNSLRFSLVDGPQGMLVHSTLGVITWRPSEHDGSSEYPVTVRVTDGGVPELEDTVSFKLTVVDRNTAPTISPYHVPNAVEGQLMEFVVRAVDTDLPKDSLTYSLVKGSDVGAVIDSESGVFNWTPSEDHGGGSHEFRVRVADSGTPILTTETSFIVTVDESNNVPTVTDPGVLEFDENVTLQYQVVASDSDRPSQRLSYQIEGDRPAGLSLGSGTGLLGWKPSEDSGPGLFSVSVRVTDSGTPPESAVHSFQLKINEVNQSPILASIADVTVLEGELISVPLSGSDVDLPANQLSYLVVSGPAGMLVQSGSNILTWTPSEADGGSTLYVTVRVTDDGEPAGIDDKSFVITVIDVNSSPEIEPVGLLIASVDKQFQRQINAIDRDLPEQQLNYALSGDVPAGLAIDSETGVISWIPGLENVGNTNTFKVHVFDSGVPRRSGELEVSIKTVNENHPPFFAEIANQNIVECDVLSLMLFAEDQDLPAQELTFELGLNTPDFITLDTAGRLTAQGMVGASSNLVTVVVTDSGEPSMSTTQSFSIVVNELGTNLVTLVSGVSGSGFASVCSTDREHYGFIVPEGASKVLFEVYGLGGDADLLVRKDELPTIAVFDYESRNDGAKSERIVISANTDMPDISGQWYLSVPSDLPSKIAYDIRATVPARVDGGSILISGEPLKVTAVPVTENTQNFEMNFGTVIGEKYQVEVSTDLLNWNVLTNIVVDGPDSRFVDPAKYSDNVQRFYRIQQVPQ